MKRQGVSAKSDGPTYALLLACRSPRHQRAENTIAAAASQPRAYIGCAPQRKIGECISPNQENAAATKHQIEARPKLRSIVSVISAAMTSTRKRKPLPSPCTDDQ